MHYHRVYFSVQNSISNQAPLLLSNAIQVTSSALQVQFTKPANFEGQFTHQNFFVFICCILVQKRKKGFCIFEWQRIQSHY